MPFLYFSFVLLLFVVNFSANPIKVESECVKENKVLSSHSLPTYSTKVEGKEE